MTVIFRPSSLASGWTFFVGVSMLMTTMNLNLMGVSFSRDSLRKHGQAGLAREWLPLALVVVAGMVLVGTVAADWTLLSTLRRPVDILTELQRLGASGPAAVVLWPFRALVRLPLAASPAEFLRVLPAAGLLLAVNFVWVVRSDASFEEASAERAEKVAQILKRGMPVTYRARPAPFTLSLTGPPETALLWKNLILLGRFASWRMVVFGPILIALGVVLTTGTGHPAVSETIARFCVVGAALSVLMGPHIVRNDLRQDLARLAVLKTWPVRGAALVRGELLAPAVVLSTAVWLFVAAAAVLSSSVMPEVAGSTAGELANALAVMLVAPGLIAVQLVALNGLAVLFPAWVTIGPTRASGLEAFGQRLVIMIGLLLVVVVAAFPAGVAAGLVGLAIYAATGSALVLPATVVATVVLLIECLLATEGIGRILDRTNIGDVDAGNRLGSRQSAVDGRQSQSSVRVFSHESQSAVRVGSRSRSTPNGPSTCG